jgi:hypothetical protein
MRFGRTFGTIVITLNILVTLALVPTHGTMRFMAFLAIIGTVKTFHWLPVDVFIATLTMEVIPILGTTLTKPLIL